MDVLAQFPLLARQAEPDVAETASILTRLLKLQHYSPANALLVLTLAANEIDTERENIEALKLKATLRGIGPAHDLATAEGGQISAEAFGQRLGVSRETVNQWRQQGRILAWKRGARNFSYPGWQIFQESLLPGWDLVLKILLPKQLGPLEIADYVLSPSEELAARPLDLLRAGQTQAVSEHARRYGGIGA